MFEPIHLELFHQIKALVCFDFDCFFEGLVDFDFAGRIGFVAVHIGDFVVAHIDFVVGYIARVVDVGGVTIVL